MTGHERSYRASRLLLRSSGRWRARDRPSQRTGRRSGSSCPAGPRRRQRRRSARVPGDPHHGVVPGHRARHGPARACAGGGDRRLCDRVDAIRPPRRIAGAREPRDLLAFPLVGGADRRGVGRRRAPATTALLRRVVLGVFMVAIVLNFLLIAGSTRVATASHARQARVAFLPLLPSHFATGMIAAGVALTYAQLGIGAARPAGRRAVSCSSSSCARVRLDRARRAAPAAHARSSPRCRSGCSATRAADAVAARPMTARHSAAVARYAREMARELGLCVREQDLIHTAGLLHDIGKFIFPDSILFADRKLTDDDCEIIRRHPEQGAKLVRRIEGYGPVAEIILAHHERIDGRGYPRGLSGDEIPLGSRIISIADTYDVMTARDSYRRPGVLRGGDRRAAPRLRAPSSTASSSRSSSSSSSARRSPSATTTTPTSRRSSPSSAGSATTRSRASAALDADGCPYGRRDVRSSESDRRPKRTRTTRAPHEGALVTLVCCRCSTTCSPCDPSPSMPGAATPGRRWCPRQRQLRGILGLCIGHTSASADLD